MDAIVVRRFEDREQFRLRLRLTWQVHPPAPGITLSGRIWLTLSILQKMIATPFAGLAWQLDELLYGRSLDQTQVREPSISLGVSRAERLGERGDEQGRLHCSFSSLHDLTMRAACV